MVWLRTHLASFLDRRLELAALAVFSLAAWTFFPTIKAGFMLDDAFLIPRLRPEWSFENIHRDFTTNVHDDPSTYLYRPVQKIMVRLQHSLSGNRAEGFHLISLAFHACNAVGVLLFAIALGGSPFAGLLAGAGYAVHPLIVDDLLAATGGESMAIFFMLSALYLLFVEKRCWAYGAGIAFYIVALFAKESAVILPVLLGAMFYVVRRPVPAYWRVLPLLLGWVPYGLLRARVVGPIEGLSFASVGRFIVTAFPNISFHALARVFFPIDLESWPPIPHMSRLWLLYGTGLLVLLIWLLIKNQRMALFGAVWFLVSFGARIPAMMLGESVFDKWISFASIGVFIPMGILMANHLRGASRGMKAIWVVGTFVVLSAWGITSLRNIQRRGSDEKNYTWAMRHGFRDFAAYRLSVIYLRTGRSARAIPYLEELLSRDPSNLDYANTLALSCWHSGQRTRAISSLKTLIAAHPGYVPARENLARMLVESERQRGQSIP